MIRFTRLISIATIVCASLPASAAVTGTLTPPLPVPLFGTKPELYLSPTFGTPLIHIRIVGLGFRAGATVYIVFLPSERSGFALKEIQQAVKVRARATLSGAFRASYTVSHDMDADNAPAVIYYVFATYDGNPRTLLAHKLAGTAFVVCALCVSH